MGIGGIGAVVNIGSSIAYEEAQCGWCWTEYHPFSPPAFWIGVFASILILFASAVMVWRPGRALWLGWLIVGLTVICFLLGDQYWLGGALVLIGANFDLKYAYLGMKAARAA